MSPILLAVALSSPIADIPIEIRHGLPTVDVQVGGESLRLFLDLGGHRAISLTEAELKRAHVQFSSRKNTFRNSHGQVLESREFIAKDVQLGGLSLGDLEGGESVFGDAAPPDRNGYIGMPVLRRYLVILDYPNKRVRLYSSGDSDALTKECGGHTFSITEKNGIAQSIGTTEFGDRVFLWDTGSTHNVIRPSKVPSDRGAGRRIDEGPPVVSVESIKLDRNDVGPQEFRLVEFGAPAVDAVLGAGLFATRTVCLDIGAAKGAIKGTH